MIETEKRNATFRRKARKVNKLTFLVVLLIKENAALAVGLFIEPLMVFAVREKESAAFQRKTAGFQQPG